jgi:hypothetical protein
MIYAQSVDENQKPLAALKLIIAIAAVWSVVFLWQQAQTSGWLSHDVIALVTAEDWSIGEYRNCTEPNNAAVKEEPYIDCSKDGAYGEPKRFKVSFYGETYKEELKDKASISWRTK